MLQEPGRDPERTAAAVGGNGDQGRDADAAALDVEHGAAYLRTWPRFVVQGLDDPDALADLGTGAHGLVHEARIQHGPWQRPAGNAPAVVTDDAGTRWSRDHHPVERHPGAGDGSEPDMREQRERAGVQRVAAQLVAGKARAIDDQHAGTRAGEHHGGHAACGAGAGNQDVEHAVTQPRARARSSSTRSRGSCTGPPRPTRRARRSAGSRGRRPDPGW